MKSRPWQPTPYSRTYPLREMENCKIYRHLDFTKDLLAFRWHILQCEGPDTLVNCIMGHHNRPNKF